MPCTVLLVEDADDSREVYAFYLRLEGFVVLEASDGEDAVAKAIELQPDVIAMDLAMSGMDGWTATATLRAHPLTLHIPIVIVTAHAFPAHEALARAAGAAAFLVNPWSPRTWCAPCAESARRATPPSSPTWGARSRRPAPEDARAPARIVFP